MEKEYFWCASILMGLSNDLRFSRHPLRLAHGFSVCQRCHHRLNLNIWHGWNCDMGEGHGYESYTSWEWWPEELCIVFKHETRPSIDLFGESRVFYRSLSTEVSTGLFPSPFFRQFPVKYSKDPVESSHLQTQTPSTYRLGPNLLQTQS